MVEIPAAMLVAFPPSAETLLDRARRWTDDVMLMEVARADYGYLADEMMAKLRPIRDTGALPPSMDFWLSEVLNLTRNCNPDAPDSPPFEPGPAGERGHQTRLFACAVLLRADAEPHLEGVDSSPDFTLAQCLISAKALDEKISEAVGGFLTWRLSQQEQCPEPLLWALALLILGIRLRAGRLEESSLGTMAEWVLAEESLERRALTPHSWEPPRLLPFSILHRNWQPLAAELINETREILDEKVRFNLELCGLLLDPGWS